MIWAVRCYFSSEKLEPCLRNLVGPILGIKLKDAVSENRIYIMLQYITLLYITCCTLDQTYNIAKFKFCNALEFCILQIM